MSKYRYYDCDARELCLALAKVCAATKQWEGSKILRHAAEHLYGALAANWREVTV